MAHMKLFIWEGEGVFEDWTCGLIVALAPNLETAAVEINKANGFNTNSYPHAPTSIVDLGDVNAEPKAWLVWGGG